MLTSVMPYSTSCARVASTSVCLNMLLCWQRCWFCACLCGDLLKTVIDLRPFVVSKVFLFIRSSIVGHVDVSAKTSTVAGHSCSILCALVSVQYVCFTCIMSYNYWHRSDRCQYTKRSMHCADVTAKHVLFRWHLVVAIANTYANAIIDALVYSHLVNAIHVLTPLSSVVKVRS